MACRWSDQEIAASLNRMGMPTGQGKTWTACRVATTRSAHGIHEKEGEWLTQSEAAAKLGVTRHRIRWLIKEKILVSEQAMPDAPHLIRAADLKSERVAAVLRRKGRPCRVDTENQFSMFPDTCEGGAE